MKTFKSDKGKKVIFIVGTITTIIFIISIFYAYSLFFLILLIIMLLIFINLFYRAYKDLYEISISEKGIAIQRKVFISWDNIKAIELEDYSRQVVLDKTTDTRFVITYFESGSNLVKKYLPYNRDLGGDYLIEEAKKRNLFES